MYVAAHWGIPAIAEYISQLYGQGDNAKRLTNLADDSQETPLECAARMGHPAVVRILLGLGSVATRKVTLLAARNKDSSEEVMALLLKWQEDEIKIIDEVVEAVARNWSSGKGVMALIFEPRRGEVMDKGVIIVAKVFNKEVIALLLKRRGDKVKIIDKVVKAVAGNL